MQTLSPYINDLCAELLGINAVNPFSQYNSSPRAVMFSSHFSQHLVIEGADTQRIQTGVGRELGKYTFSIKMPANGKILKVIEKFPMGVGLDSIEFNPTTTVIYENDETKEIDYINIPYFASFHQFFGFKYDIKDTVSQITPGAYIAKDTIFADSPAVGKHGDYMFGINANVAFMSIPSVSEDGMMICRDFLPKLRFKVFETRVIEFGSSKFPLNIYGNKDKYQPFPDIGEYVNANGLLMMLRSYDDDLHPVEMSVMDTMEPDYLFDKGVYVRPGRGKVIDINITANNGEGNNLPEAMCGFINKYFKANQKYHQEIIATEQKLRHDYRTKYTDGKLKLSPKFHRLVVESLAVTNHDALTHKQNLNLMHRKGSLDEYRVEITVEYIIEPRDGFKLTDQHGGKATICKIEEPENMPVDADGNRADIVMDAASIISRMNIGKPYEHYFGGAVRDVCKYFYQILGIPKGKVTIEALQDMDQDRVGKAYKFLLDFYKIVSTKQYNFYKSIWLAQSEELYEHLVDVVADGIYLYYPVDNEKNIIEVVKSIEAHYTLTYGPVSYVGNSGRRVMTKDKVRIAPMYMMLLEKITDDLSSVSTGKLQHFGILTQITKAEKFMQPHRDSPGRTIGETEGRIFAAYCGREAIAEMMDKSNNPATQRNMVHNILSADKPTNIVNVVDREYIKLGGTKPIALLNHVLGCYGFKTVYEKEGA